MKINKLNYENYVIDYIEGTLSIELKKDFDLFLEKNEEVYEEIKDYISAPVLEESTVVFEDKKSLKKSNSLSPYLLLAFIPILLLGAYFLMPKTPEKAEPVELKTTEMVNQFAQAETNESQSIIKEPIKKQVDEIKTEQQLEKVVSQRKSTPKPMINSQIEEKEEVLFASSETPTTIQSGDKLRMKIVKPSAPLISASPGLEKVNQIAALETLSLNAFENSSSLAQADAAMANLTPQARKIKTQTPERSSWLEMITPASFEDIDLRESLAIESNVEINTSKKILNAFIPESFVK